ncbi:hypothetical protein DFH28DRAFT_926631 [Melampsora americana]|nr:hypothetical protein DFH28DRAFT_926631 [Melampsora americana]
MTLFSETRKAPSKDSSPGSTAQAVVRTQASTIQIPSANSKSTETWGDPFVTPEFTGFTTSITLQVSNSMSISSAMSHDAQVPKTESNPFLPPNSTVDITCFLRTTSLQHPTPFCNHVGVGHSPKTSGNVASDDGIPLMESKAAKDRHHIRGFSTPPYNWGYTSSDVFAALPLMESNSPKQANINTTQSKSERPQFKSKSPQSESESPQSKSESPLLESSIIPYVSSPDSHGIEMLLDAACVISRQHAETPTAVSKDSRVNTSMDIDVEYDVEIPSRWSNPGKHQLAITTDDGKCKTSGFPFK